MTDEAMSEIHRWYVIWRGRGEEQRGAAWGTAGPFDTHAEAILRMQELKPAEPDCEFTIADVLFPNDARAALGLPLERRK